MKKLKRAQSEHNDREVRNREKDKERGGRESVRKYDHVGLRT